MIKDNRDPDIINESWKPKKNLQKNQKIKQKPILNKKIIKIHFGAKIEQI